MFYLLGGIALFTVTCGLFARALPRNGKSPPFVGTEWEAYIAVLFCGGFVLGFAMILSAVFEVVGPR